MPTLADVAKVAGVGVMSVSRVVNGTRKVSKGTEDKVLAAIRRIGYEPNEAAKVLKGQRARIFGLIVPDIADPFFATCANAVQLSAREAGYITWMVSSNHQASIERQQAEIMIQKQIAGLIVAPMDPNADYFLKATAAGLPIVALDRPLAQAEADAVMVDNREASALLVEHLLGHGHQHILCVTDEQRIITRQERLAGYAQAMQRAQLPLRVCTVGPAHGSFATQFSSLFAADPKPTAIFTLGDLLTVEVLRHLQDLRIDIPQQIALASFDDFDAATLVFPRITVIQQPVAALGHKAVSLLLERTKGQSLSPAVHSVLKTELIIRQSCGCGLGASASRSKRSPSPPARQRHAKS